MKLGNLIPAVKEALSAAKVKLAGLSGHIATLDNDPEAVYKALDAIPNVDAALEAAGKTAEAHRKMLKDSHIMGEVAAFRSGILSFEHKVHSVGDEESDKLALALCKHFFYDNWKNTPEKPNSYSLSDIIFQIAFAELTGYRVHEIGWQATEFDGKTYLLPAYINPVKNARIIYNGQHEPRLLTKEQKKEGEQLGQYRWLITRHMADEENPYGVAKLSACLLPMVLKYSGLQSFGKLAKRFGIPWTIGKFPPGTEQKDIDKFTENLTQMVEASVATLPDTGQIEVIESNATGGIHPDLIKICNREMSKALRSQTLATEITDQGSRAASETHSDRERQIDEATREMVANTLSLICQWITEINVPDAVAPQFMFYQEESPNTDWIEAFDIAKEYMPIPLSFAQQMTKIPAPVGDEPLLGQSHSNKPESSDNASFAAAQVPSLSQQIALATAHADDWLESEFIDKIKNRLDEVIANGGDLNDFAAELPTLLESEVNIPLSQLNALAGVLAHLKGASDA